MRQVLFLLLLAPLMGYVPLAALAAVLLVVAWNMAEVEQFRNTLAAPWGDRVVLLATFLLTVAFDLTVAIQVGVVLAAFVFMVRMAEAVEVRTEAQVPQNGGAAVEEDLSQRAELPEGVEVYRIGGPVFFGVADRIGALLDGLPQRPQVLILRMRQVPVIDASGVHALRSLAARCQRKGIALIISGLQPQPKRVIAGMRRNGAPGEVHFTSGFEPALALARTLLEERAREPAR